MSNMDDHENSMTLLHYHYGSYIERIGVRIERIPTGLCWSFFAPNTWNVMDCFDTRMSFQEIRRLTDLLEKRECTDKVELQASPYRVTFAYNRDGEPAFFCQHGWKAYHSNIYLAVLASGYRQKLCDFLAGSLQPVYGEAACFGL